jgi:hypothetical protein
MMTTQWFDVCKYTKFTELYNEYSDFYGLQTIQVLVNFMALEIISG